MKVIRELFVEQWPLPSNRSGILSDSLLVRLHRIIIVFGGTLLIFMAATDDAIAPHDQAAIVIIGVGWFVFSSLQTLNWR